MFHTLLEFPLGRPDDRTTIAAPGIDREKGWLLLMVQTRLPMPRLPESTTQALVDQPQRPCTLSPVDGRPGAGCHTRCRSTDQLGVAEALDPLLRPGWPVQVVDWVLHERTPQQTPMGAKITARAAAETDQEFTILVPQFDEPAAWNSRAGSAHRFMHLSCGQVLASTGSAGCLLTLSVARAMSGWLPIQRERN
jgi:hypothetical protein